MRLDLRVEGGHGRWRSVERDYCPADRDLARRQDPRPKPGPMDERPQDRLAEEVGQVLAGLAQPRSFALDLADAEPLADQLVETDPAGRHVAPALAGGEDDAIGRREVLEDLGFDEGDVAVGRRIGRPGATSGGVAVAFEPDPGDGMDALQ